MNKKKIYIAGKVTGEDIAECTMKFGNAQKEIEALGFEAVNPLEVVGSFQVTWEEAMKRCIKALMDCDKVYMLPCSARSQGAKLETSLAWKLNISIAKTIKELQL